jgi:dihydroorotate dehydrogenase (NAD+) catalytic subunit
VNLVVEMAPNNRRGLLLKNPVMTASGTFGYGTEYADFVDVQRLGAIVCKGTTLEPREGNPQPRLAETPSGLLNSIGLQNIGVEALVKEKAPLWASWQVPVIVNIAGESIDEYAGLAARLDGVAGISGLEVNIGCPNVKSGGMEFGTDPCAAASVTAAVKKASSLPVIVKLTPNVTSIVEIAEAAEDAGADALCLINTLRGMAIDVSLRKPSLGNICGGLSGPAVKPVALYMVYQVAGSVKLPIVGCGGIESAQDALEFIMAGASAVEVGTAQFVNPRVLLDVIEGIEDFMRREGVKDIADLVGAAR